MTTQSIDFLSVRAMPPKKGNAASGGSKGGKGAGGGDDDKSKDKKAGTGASVKVYLVITCVIYYMYL